MKRAFQVFLTVSGLILFLKGYRVGEYLALLGSLMLLYRVDICRYRTIVTITFFTLIVALKLVQYRFYISTGYDLGIFTNILHNISHHGRIFDSLNGRHGFSGHIWPAAYVLSLFFYLWDHPVLLLVLQSLAISMVIPVLCVYGRGYRYMSLVSLLLIYNIYLHRVSSFDFHPESLAIPLVVAGVFALEEGKNPGFFLILLFTLTLKEDIAFGWLSIALYFLISRDYKKAMKIAIPTAFYSFLAFLLLLKFVDIQAMKQLHYTGDFNPLHRIKPTLEFFASLGFLPLFGMKETSIFSLPLIEHLTSGRRIHFRLRCQYSALLVPLSIIAFLKSERKVSEKWLKILIIFGIAFSINARPIGAYFDIKKLDLEKSRYTDRLLGSIPGNTKICAGNHIVPHIATRDSATQFPYISDAEIILLDTTWHDYTPISEDSATKIINGLINSGKYRVVSDSFGVLFLKHEKVR